MNRNVVIGGVAGTAAVLGVAGWYFLSGPGAGPGGGFATQPTGPMTLNTVTVVTDQEASQSPDGRTLSVTFPKFELVAKAGETTSSVFSTTWHLKLGANERAVASIASVQGFMKSAGMPPPAQPIAQPATPVVDTTSPPATPVSDPPPATDGATPPPADKPAATPTAAAPAQPVAGDGVARVIVSIGGETTVTEWRDWTGNGADHQLSKAVAYVGTPADLRDGASVPVTVTVELAGGTSTETISRLNSLVLRVVAEEAPIPVEPGSTPGTATDTTTPPATDAPATPAPAEPAPATPPADGTTPPATPTP
ncbi:MAG: hypothetical protein ACKVRO_05520 [Micropepsaceae bacterium]